MSLWLKIVFTIFGLATLILSPKLFVFMVVSMAPAFVAYIIDRMPGKNISTTVALFNFSGFSIFAGEMLQGSGSIRNLSDALDPFKLMVVYLFAAVGWFIIWIVPKLAIIIFEYKDQVRIDGIEKKITKLEEEWGVEIRD